MALKQKINKLLKKIELIVVANKKIVIAGFLTLVITMFLTLNINLFQVTVYRINKEQDKLIQLLDKKVLNTKNQQDLYFKMGINYLLDSLDETSQQFVEINFSRLHEDIKYKIIESYNNAGLFFENQKQIFEMVAKGEVKSAYRTYIQRMEREFFEKELSLYFGENPKVTQDLVTRLYNILEIKKEKITMDHLRFSMYELISFPHQGDMERTAIKLLGYIEPSSVREVLFKELKMKDIDVDQLYIWIEVLSKKNIIDNQEYAVFVKNYNEIKRIREENKGLLLQEVDLMNVKEKIDLKTNELVTKLNKNEKELLALETTIQQKEDELNRYTHYKEMDIYILDQYQNGEFEGAIPEKSWLLGNYKPGNQRVRLKVTKSTVRGVGVQAFNVYGQGEDANGVPYYIEVSQEDEEKISSLKQDIRQLEKEIAEKASMMEVVKQEIEQIRKAQNYEQTIELLNELQNKKEQLQVEIKGYQVEIQNLFGIGNVIIEI